MNDPASMSPTVLIGDLVFSTVKIASVAIFVYIIFSAVCSLKTKGSGTCGKLKLKFKSAEQHRVDVDFVCHQVKLRKEGQRLSLQRRAGNSNTIRNEEHKSRNDYCPVDVSKLNSIIEIDPVSMTAWLEPSVPFDHFLEATLQYELCPSVVVEFPGITVGGAVSGAALESSSFLHGQVSDAVVELEVILPASGEKVVATARNKYSDLFYGVSGAYGSIALIVGLRIKLQRASRFVEISLSHCSSSQALEAEIRKLCTTKQTKNGRLDFLEAVCFSETSYVIVKGKKKYELAGGSAGAKLRRFSRHWDQWYYKFLQDQVEGLVARQKDFIAAKTRREERKEDGEVLQEATDGAHPTRSVSNSQPGPTAYPEHPTATEKCSVPSTPGSKSPLCPSPSPEFHDSASDALTFVLPLRDYVFRYNFGAFWMASYVFDFVPLGDCFLTRLLLGAALSTRRLFQVMHSSKTSDLGRLRVIQDLYVPLTQLPHFLDYLHTEVGVYPLWLCPVMGTSTPQILSPHFRGRTDGSRQSWCQSNREDSLLVNVGVYGRPRQFPFNVGKTNKDITHELAHVGGRKMLYAQTWYTRQEFWEIYDAQSYKALRQKYGGDKALFSVEDKVLLSDREREALSVPVGVPEKTFLKSVVKQIFTHQLKQMFG